MDENNVHEAEIVEEEVKGGFLASLIDIYLDPSKVFKRIDAGLQWWKAFIVLAIINMAITWVNLPLQRQLASLNPGGIPADQLEARLQVMDRFSWIGVVTTPIFIIVVLMIVAGLVNVISNLVSARSEFKKTLSLITFAGMIGLLEQILTTVIVHMRGIETIEAPGDAVVRLGPGALLPDAGGFLAAALQALSVFQIWYYIVFVLGLAYIFRMSWKKALVPAFVLWILSVVFIMVGQKMSGLS